MLDGIVLVYGFGRVSMDYRVGSPKAESLPIAPEDIGTRSHEESSREFFTIQIVRPLL
jgi:hypothetical protein